MPCAFFVVTAVFRRKWTENRSYETAKMLDQWILVQYFMGFRIFIYLCDNNVDKLKEMMNSDFLVSGNFGLFIAVTIFRKLALSGK